MIYVKKMYIIGDLYEGREMGKLAGNKVAGCGR